MIVRDFLICLLQMYLLEDLEKNMLPYRRENFWGKFLVYFVVALIMLGINHLESSIFNMVMIPVTYMIVSMVVFRGNIWKKLVIVCCYYVLAIIPEFLFATLTNAYGVTGASEGFGTEIEKTLALLLMSTMTFLFIKCINQVTRKRDYLTIENKTFTVLLMLPTATIIILGCVFYSNISFEGMNRVMVPVGASLLLLTNIFIFSVFDRFVEKSEEVKKMDRLYQKSRAEIANLQYMNKVNEDNRAFLHDINKFICTVAGLMEEGENQEVKEIMEHLGVRIQSLQKGVYCEHPILNSILCERKFLAESKNISYKITLGNDLRLDFLEELDQLDIKIFRFEKMETCYDQLNEEEQAEEERNILNGLNFARKVIATQECDFLVLDEILGLLDKHIATVDMVVGLLKQKDESMHLILTGNRVDPGILDYVDSVTTITTLGREQNS